VREFDGGRKLFRIMPAAFPDPVRACIGERKPERRPQQQDGLSQLKLLGERRSHWRGPEQCPRTDRCKSKRVGRFADPHDIEPWSRVWPQCRAHESDRQLRPVEQGTAVPAIGRHEFGGGKVGPNPLQRDADHLAALNSLKAAIPAWKPLRREACQRREHQAHQGQCDQSLDQRKTALKRPLPCDQARHFADPWIKRTVFSSDTAPDGERT
jgi:hypothetical protein